MCVCLFAFLQLFGADPPTSFIECIILNNIGPSAHQILQHMSWSNYNISMKICTTLALVMGRIQSPVYITGLFTNYLSSIVDIADSFGTGRVSQWAKNTEGMVGHALSQVCLVELRLQSPLIYFFATLPRSHLPLLSTGSSK